MFEKLLSADETYDHAFVRFAFGPLPVRIPGYAYAHNSDPCNDPTITYFDSLCFQDDDNINRLSWTYVETFFCFEKAFKIKKFKQKLYHQVRETEPIQKLPLPQSIFVVIIEF